MLHESERTLHAMPQARDSMLQAAQDELRRVVAAGELTRSIELFQRYRDRFPDSVFGYVGAGEALVALGRYEQADTLLREALLHFNDEPTVGIAYAAAALARGDGAEAFLRWAKVCDRHSNQPQVHVDWAQALVAAACYTEAEDVLSRAIARFPDDRTVAAAYSQLPHRQRNYAEALERWRRFRERFPDDIRGPAGMAENLMDQGRLEEADELLADSLAAFPNAERLHLLHAITASRQHKWTEVFRRLERLRSRFPRADLDTYIGEALHGWKLACDEGEESAREVELPAEFAARLAATSASDPQLGDKSSLPARQLMMQFESLGDHCEFGLVQRHFGAEPLSLLRWCAISPTDLASALAAGFSGVGEPEHTYLRINEAGEYLIGDRRWFHMHTFIRAGEMPVEKVFQTSCRRLQYLRRKLREDLEQSEKIFVYRKHEQLITDDEVAVLRHAFHSNYPTATLMIVTTAGDRPHLAGRAIRCGSRSLMGYVDRFSDLAPKLISFSCWEKLCRNAIRELQQS